MKGSINSPHRIEPQTTYTQQDLARGIELVREAESTKCPRTTIIDTLVTILCPCISVAQVASSVGLSYYAVLVGYGLLSVLGFVTLLISSTLGREYMDVDVVGILIFIRLLMFFFGPIISFTLIMVLFARVGSEGDNRIPHMFLPSIVWDIVFAVAAQQVRNRLRHRVDLPRDGLLRVFFSTLCCVWYNIAATTTSAKKYTHVDLCHCVGEFHFGPLDTIPGSQSSEKQMHSAV